jgi:hypothetical protein
MNDHDSGTITAHRSEFNNKENQQRNRSLLAKLTDKRYGVTSVEGSYIENMGTDKQIEVGEHVYFVVDANDDGNLEKNLRELGEYFDQDSILFIPKGKTEGILIGTTKREIDSPKYGERKSLPNAIWGKNGQFMTKIKGRPFYFKEDVELIPRILPEGFFGRWGCNAIANTHWSKLEV